MTDTDAQRIIAPTRADPDRGPIPDDEPGSPISQVRDLGLAINRRRKAMHLNLSDAAALCNVGTRFLHELENGKETIEFGRAIKVAMRFGIRLRLAESPVEGS